MDMMNEIMPFVKGNPILCLAWIGLFIAVIFLTIKAQFSKVKIIDNFQLIDLMNNQEAAVFDIRTMDQFKFGHITDARHVLPSDIKQGNITAIEKFKSHPVVVVCDNGLQAPQSAELLLKLGFTDVSALKEGIIGWDSRNLPLIKK